jgi:hypothetical protein
MLALEDHNGTTVCHCLLELSSDASRLRGWQESSNIVNGIVKYEERGQLVVGYCERRTPRPGKSGWFLFDCATGKSDDFASEQLLVEACEKRGFSPPLEMKTIRENWTLYWKDPNRRKN